MYELFIDATRMEILPTEVLFNVFDFLLKMAHSNGPQLMTNRICIDLLSVIMIHLVVDETQKLLPQMLSFDIVNFFYKILQSPLVEVREYTFKIICLLLTRSKKIRDELSYTIIEDILSLQE